jgi:hypothetical protein
VSSSRLREPSSRLDDLTVAELDEPVAFIGFSQASTAVR